MENRDKRHRITITVSDSELDALEDSLIVWNLCKKHNAMTSDLKAGNRGQSKRDSRCRMNARRARGRRS